MMRSTHLARCLKRARERDPDNGHLNRVLSINTLIILPLTHRCDRAALCVAALTSILSAISAICLMNGSSPSARLHNINPSPLPPASTLLLADWSVAELLHLYCPAHFLWTPALIGWRESIVFSGGCESDCKYDLNEFLCKSYSSI